MTDAEMVEFVNAMAATPRLAGGIEGALLLRCVRLPPDDAGLIHLPSLGTFETDRKYSALPTLFPGDSIYSTRGSYVSRKLLPAIAAAAAAASLLLAGTAPAAPIKVVGKVGPGYTISLTIGGKKVTKLKAGVAYRFVISDRSSDHDFRIMGPGVSKIVTAEEFTGTRTVVLKLRKGSYRFLCAPHSDEMRGSFTAR